MQKQVQEFYISSEEQLDSFLFNTSFKLTDIICKPDHWIIKGYFKD